MTENIAQSVQKAIQDLVAPDVRELKVLISSLQKQMDQRFDATDQRFDDQNAKVDSQFKAMDAQFKAIDAQFKAIDQRFDDQNARSDAQFKALMAALGEFKAQSELATMQVISALSERVAVIESRLR